MKDIEGTRSQVLQSDPGSKSIMYRPMQAYVKAVYKEVYLTYK